MTDHPVPRARPEAVPSDTSDRICGPLADQVGTAPAVARAESVRVGDVLLLDDGTRAEVTDLRYGWYWFSEGRGQGIAIGWRSGGSSGLLFRRATDIVSCVDAEPPS